MREAAGQLGARGRGDGSGGAEGRGGRRALHGGLQLPQGAGARAGPAAGGAGQAGQDPPGAGAVSAGLAGGPGVPAGLAAAQGPGGLGGARRPGRAQHRRGAVPDRAADLLGGRGAGDVRDRAPAARQLQRPVGHGEHRARRGHGGRRGALHGAFRRRRDRGVRGDAVRHRAQERDADRDQRLGGLAGLRRRVDERTGLPRPLGGLLDRRFPAHPGDRADPPVPGRLVAARPPDRLRAHLHPPGAGLRHGGRGGYGPAPVVRRRPAGAEGARGRRVQCGGARRAHPGAGRARQALTHRPAPVPPDTARPLLQEDAHGTTRHAVHRPVRRPALHRGVPAGLAVGLRRPGDRLLGRPLRRRGGARRRRLPAAAARHPGQARAEVLDDLLPPDRAGGLRPPHRRAAQGHPAVQDLGRRRARGGAHAGRGGDQEHRAGGGGLRRGHRGGLHRFVDLAHGGDVPAGAAGHDRPRLPGLRRPLEPDPGRLRRGRGALRARGAPQRDRVRLLDDGAHA
ncbi:hypothetical protein SBRY_60431 [Actinacidiphila bryophytorum]|uniref:Uncharacterized protein n=1 Tax=Actinacidiphila bryophytorum TaxID=1436133 RepID=A0A9W4H6J6_9ACTN|nr:hypothetical protein SBRY_60431 [Actinacidiphila bryophytorum]